MSDKPKTIDLMEALLDSLGKSKPPAYCRDCGTYLDGGMIARSKDNPRLCVECAHD